AEDEHRIKLVLTFIADMRITLEDSALISGLNKVLEVLVGRETTGTPYALKTNSILYILRHNLNIDATNNLRTDIRSFSVVMPSQVSSNRFQGLYSAEGNITFNCNYIQQR
ncbi:MAG: hypothetical protein NTY22_07660, partial [Proteobacteria bacterium]|nr:hypothetical protein [Pseudomonadota bacterium]